MTESEFTSPITKYLKDEGVLTFKHSDQFSKAVPDMSASIGGHTTWLEMKMLRHPETFYQRVSKDKLQFQHMQWLQVASRAAYIIYWFERIYIIPPLYLANVKPSNDGVRNNSFKDDSDFFFRSHDYSEWGIPISIPKTDYRPILSLLRAK